MKSLAVTFSPPFCYFLSLSDSKILLRRLLKKGSALDVVQNETNPVPHILYP
jgi:hypothetical protein